MANLKSVFKAPEGSIMAALATAGTVYAIYQLNVGTSAQAQVTGANHPALESSRKKAGYTAFAIVSALVLITRDGNVGVIGYGSIIAMEASYRHSIMADPVTGQIVPPTMAAYQPAQNVTPIRETA